jgi:hypothetical protein
VYYNKNEYLIQESDILIKEDDKLYLKSINKDVEIEILNKILENEIKK